MADAVAPRREPPYRRHFGLVYFLLAAVVGAAVASVVFLLSRPAYQKPPAWSTWQPNGDIDTRVEEILDFVSARYRLPSRDVLVNVRATRPTIQGQPVPAYVVRSETGLRTGVIDAQAGLMYTMCGGAAGCSIVGNPSQERFQAIRREALELALYTFKYVDGVENILVVLPPTYKEDAKRPGRRLRDDPAALLFVRDVLEPALERPLTTTLRRQGLIVVPGPADPAEGAVVDRITAPLVFKYEARQDANGDALLLLERPQP